MRPDELGPCVGEDEVLDALFRLVEDGSGKVLGDLTPVVHARLDGRGRDVHGLLGACGVGRRRRLHVVVGALEGSDHIRVALLTIQDTSGLLEDVLELAKILVGDVDGELGVVNTDELGVDVQSVVEALADNILRVTVDGAIPNGGGNAVLPLRNADEEGNVFTGEFAEGGEFQKRDGVALEDVFQGTHGQDTVGGAVGLDGAVHRLPARHDRSNEGRAGGERLALGAGDLVVALPLRDRVESLLAERAGTHHLPARKEDGEDLNEEDRKNDPLRRQPNGVDGSHGRHVESDKPHRGGVEVGNSAANGLGTPAVGVVDVARLPQDVRSEDPRPEELPGHTRPPLPATTLLGLLFHDGAGNLGAGNAPGAVPLAGNDEHQDSEEDLNEHGDADEVHDLRGVVETTELAEQAGVALGLSSGIDEVLAIVVDVLLLKLGDVKEATVGSVEQSNTTRQIGTHDPELDISRHEVTDQETELNTPAIQVKEKDGRERQPEASDPDSRRVPVGDEIAGTCHDDGGPDATKGHPPDAHRRSVQLRLGVGGHTELGSHD